MQDIIFIHRGRNARSKEIGKLFTDTDYNFDYRGKNPLVLLLKAFITMTEVPKADIYFVEGGLCLNVAVMLKLFKNRKAKIIPMIMEPFFYLKGMPGYKRKYLSYMMSKVTGMIAICDMIEKDARQIYQGPVRIAHRYILNIESYKKITANVDSKVALFVVERPKETGYIKGMDVAIDAFKEIKKKYPDAELRLIGSGTEKLPIKDKSIKLCGYQDVKKHYKEASIVLAPARYDAFPFAVAESCCAGCIPIVSVGTGSQEYVRDIDPQFVCQRLDVKGVAQQMDRIWSASKKERAAWSKKAKIEGAKINKERSEKEFKKAWNQLTRL